MTYCTSCPELAARIRDITYPHNKLYWATVIFLTLSEMAIVLINCIIYAKETEEQATLIILSTFQLILDSASLVIAKGIFDYLSKADKNRPSKISTKRVPKSQACVFHFITSFPSEWIRFSCCVLMMSNFEEEYSITIVMQCFLGPVMSFYTLRQMVFNALIWVNSNDCQYVLNSLFTHLAITANFFWVMIMLSIATLSREWTDGNQRSAVVLAVGSAIGQLGTLFIILVQGFKKQKKKKKSVVPESKDSPRSQKKLRAQASSARLDRFNKIKKFIPKSMMDDDFGEQEMRMGLAPLNENTLVQEIQSLIQNHPHEWVSIQEVEIHLKIKLQFSDWSEYGYMDHKQFLVRHKKIFQMKFRLSLIHI